MTKKRKLTKKRKNLRSFLNKRILSLNFIVLLSFLFVFSLFAYFLYEKEVKKVVNLEKDILIKEKKYTNEEVMQEVLSSLKAQSKINLAEEIKKLEENNKELKEDIPDDIIKKVEKIREEKKEAKIQKEQEILVEQEIKDEIIEEKIKKKEKKNLITKKDQYKHTTNKKAKLIIIIDDVVSKTQKDKILNIGYPVTMSFLPPTIDHKNSASVASSLAFYMVHLPLQASNNFKNPEVNTLNIYDSYEKIEERIKKIRQWYPKAIYINNHTGSVFTQNYEAMDKLFKALKKYKFIFVDSKTSPNSVAKELSIKYDMPYIVRDIFLDNNKTFTYIQNQLKEAIKIAKKQGYSISIGHPYDITIKVLKESKHLLKDLDLVFLDKLPYLEKR